MQKRYIIVIIFLLLLLTHRYNKAEIDNLAYVVAIGADTSEDDNLNITYQIAVPLKIISEGVDDIKTTYTTYSVKASSLAEANKKINSMISKELNLSQVKLIVYSKKLAENDLSGHINGLISHKDIRPRTIIAIYDGDAENFLKNISPKLENNVSRYYELLFNSHSYSSESIKSELWEFYNSTIAKDKMAFAIFLKSENNDDKPEATPSGLAMFSGTKMIDVLPKEKILSHQILTNTLDYTNYSVKDFNDNQKVISVRIRQITKPKIKVYTNNNSPYIECNANIKCQLISSGSAIDFKDEKNKSKLIDDLKASIENDLTDYLETIKKSGSDIAGLGRFAKRNFITWQEFENYDWLEKFKNASFKVNVNIDLDVEQIVSHTI